MTFISFSSSLISFVWRHWRFEEEQGKSNQVRKTNEDVLRKDEFIAKTSHGYLDWQS